MSTLAWYGSSFRALGSVLENDYSSVHEFKAAVTERIGKLQREGRGNSAISINTYLRCFKAFLNWCCQEGMLQEPIKLPWLKEEQKVLATLPEQAVQSIIAWRPRTRTQFRLHACVCLILDTGIRISEALGLVRDDLDLEELLLRVRGKGNKQRVVPISIELRKILWRYISREESARSANSERNLFCTHLGTRLSQRDVLKDLKALGMRLGITGVRMSPHTLRHTFAVNYIRNGGDVFRLQRILGHSTLEMTRRYVNLQTADLQAVHSKLSPLSVMARRG